MSAVSKIPDAAERIEVNKFRDGWLGLTSVGVTGEVADDEVFLMIGKVAAAVEVGDGIAGFDLSFGLLG